MNGALLDDRPAWPCRCWRPAARNSDPRRRRSRRECSHPREGFNCRTISRSSRAVIASTAAGALRRDDPVAVTSLFRSPSTLRPTNAKVRRRRRAAGGGFSGTAGEHERIHPRVRQPSRQAHVGVGVGRPVGERRLAIARAARDRTRASQRCRISRAGPSAAPGIVKVVGSSPPVCTSQSTRPGQRFPNAWP